MTIKTGQKHPFLVPLHDSAQCALFTKSGNILNIMLTKPDSKDVKSIRRGKLKVGILEKDTAILLLWHFHDHKDRPRLLFDSPFDIRRLPADRRDLYSKDKPEQRLAIHIVLIETHTAIVRGNRLVTLPVPVSDQLMALVMDQIAHPEKAAAAAARQNQWAQQPLDQLAAQTRFYQAGI